MWILGIKPDLLQEQPMLLATEPFLLALIITFGPAGSRKVIPYNRTLMGGLLGERRGRDTETNLWSWEERERKKGTGVACFL